MKRNINVRETLTSNLSHALPQGTWPATEACAMTRNQTADLLHHWMMPNQLKHTGLSFFFF